MRYIVGVGWGHMAHIDEFNPFIHDVDQYSLMTRGPVQRQEQQVYKLSKTCNIIKYRRI